MTEQGYSEVHFNPRESIWKKKRRSVVCLVLSFECGKKELISMKKKSELVSVVLHRQLASFFLYVYVTPIVKMQDDFFSSLFLVLLFKKTERSCSSSISSRRRKSAERKEKKKKRRKNEEIEIVIGSCSRH